MNLTIALTAARYGAAIANYTEVVHLVKGADPQTRKERVCRAHCGDVITGKSKKSHFLPACLTLHPLFHNRGLASFHIVIAHLIQGILIFYKPFTG